MLIRQGIEFGEYLNADDIARELDGPPSDVSLRAQQIVRERRSAALIAGRDHAFETVMSHPSHIDHMRDAARAGFTVRLNFIATEDPVINLDRVANRVVHGGHDVPMERIIDRYHRCLTNLPAAIRTADHCAIFDNSSADAPLRLVTEVHSQGQIVLPSRAKIDFPVWWLEIFLEMWPRAGISEI